MEAVFKLIQFEVVKVFWIKNLTLKLFVKRSSKMKWENGNNLLETLTAVTCRKI